MKKTFFYILIGTLQLAIFSCNKSSNSTNNRTSGSGYSWSCKVDGVSYSWSSDKAVDSEGSGACQYNAGEQAFTIGMTTNRPNASNITIGFVFPQYITGSKVLNNQTGPNSALLQLVNTTETFVTTISSAITLNITDAGSNRVSGTFQGSLSNLLGSGTVQVTDGKFSLANF
jgi:hypothetical protein